MSYLLDTNVFIELLSERSPRVRQRSTEAIESNTMIYLSTIVEFELLYDVHKSVRAEANRRRLNLLLGSELLFLPFDREDAATAGRLRAVLEQTKQSIGAYDLLIAAQAVRRGLTLITANVREFARVEGLVWQDWSTN